ncbi:sigma-54-dependent transcriptional regulator [Sediminicoccus rosea]|jgi:DNA-binding NtrC family response regulator|uniref:Sigma-54 dependent transcriptional regulator n=1 Tax=Sediminicoccus rosea TaxID=1225128 RepID=A0ABZ0PC53_9PROT|nr:sigma-54 dependent transcriptional regulator [Sediminicoccus rosea]WPB83284.1 sigma-54 dependent transcriptional regulator [Sediminicoccus rosea]
MTTPKVVLVVEDDPVIGPALAHRLRLEGYRPRLAETGAAALREARALRPDAVVSDIRLPDMSGEEVYLRLLADLGALPAFFMTAFGDVAQAVRLVRAGARDYLTKPLDVDRLVEALGAALASAPAAPSEGREPAGLGVSAAMRGVEAMLRKAARVDVPVVLTGETGVGKEVAARFLHAASARAGEPFVALNCAAVPRDLAESTLFGHERGAFTGAATRQSGLAERAGAGTLLLDEIAELAPELQAKLLRLVQERAFLPLGAPAERRFAARLVCATHADLAARVRAGSFREDLYYRLHVIPVEIPPLRRRVEDLPWLAERLLSEAVARFGLGARRLSPPAAAALADHDWPGNVRELRNRIERAVALAEGEEIGPDDLFPESQLERAAAAAAPMLGAAIQGATRLAVSDALARAGGNRAEAARLLGVSRTTLWKRMRELGLTGE